jgi:hypothetical protein
MIPQYRRLLQTATQVIYLSRNVSDDFHSNQLAAHACVLLSGVIEGAVREILPAFSDKKSHPGIATYVKHSLKGFANPSPEKLFTLLSQFDPKIETKLTDQNFEQLRDHIGSIVGNRHLIAHGKNTGITPNRVDEWRKSTVKFCDFVDANFSAD